ncbi:MAG: MFS transporter [Caldiserica bacterium]|nr:MFS transporter [Caldisericota bacterium]
MLVAECNHRGVRWNRKLTMMLSDLLAVTATIAALVLYLSGHLQIWHLYVAASMQGLGSAFQWPACSAAISQMMPKQHYARASGLMSLADSGSIIVAPILAGFLIRFIHVGGILTIDIVTFGFAALALLSSCLGTMVNGLSQSIWQAKVPAGLQGRVFSARRMIAWIVMPMATLLAGPLADRVFEPAMRTGGVLVPLFSRVVGTGPGAGMAVLYLLSATAASVVTLAGFLIPRLRDLEKLLPDHDTTPASNDVA